MKEYFICGKGKSGKDLYFSGYTLQWHLPIWNPDPNNKQVIKYPSRKAAKETLKYLKERYGYRCLKVIKKKG